MEDNKQSRVARRNEAKKKPKKKPVWKKILLIIGIIFLLVGLSVGALFTYYIATAPAIDPAKLSDPFSSQLLEQNGELFADLGEIKRTKIEYDDLPQVLIDAVTATEDVRFFTHPGIDIRRIGGAIKANLTRGFGAEGASTITQQVAENSFLKSDKKIKLKVQEQWIALKLEREYSKEQILEMYLNKIFYGSNSYGVAEASKTYFGKSDLHELTLVEAAILAGLPQRPTAYNPYASPELTQGRVNTVLKLMVRHGKITEAEAEEARNVDIPSLLVGKKTGGTKYDAFIQQVEREVREKLDGVDIYTDGLKIYTTLDSSIQDHVEFLLTDSEDNPIPFTDDEMKAGVVVLDTNNGAIRAIGGSRNPKSNPGGYNYAIQGGQQPGSTFKPLLVYGPAIEYNKLSTYHQLNDDKPHPIPGTDHEIRNWNNKYEGWMTSRYALSRSLNVPTMKLFDEVGTANAQKFAEGLGIKFAEDKIRYNDAIGGDQTNTTPLNLAGAYRGFANEGISNEPYAITKVEFPDGKVVEFKAEPQAVMSDSTAYMVTDMLKTAMTEGTGIPANIPGLAVAGKSGTTSIKGKPGRPDSWFAGYTTNFTIAIWTGGYSDEDGKRDVMPDNAVNIPKDIFKNLMGKISTNIETADFVRPDSVVEIGIERGSNPPMLPSQYTPSQNIVKELFVKGHEPSKKSEKFDKLDPVKDLKAKFDEDNNEIEVEWDYDSDGDVSFEVSTSINGGQMNVLQTTTDDSIEISSVESGAEYTIQVVVISKNGSNKSDAKTTKVTVPEEEDNENNDENNEDNESNVNNENNGENNPDEGLEQVNNLNASYNSEGGFIDVVWEYNGSPTSFEVDVNGQKQNVSSNGIEISGVTPGTNYLITVTPIGQNGVDSNLSQSTDIDIPAPEENNSGNNTEE